MSRPSKCPPEFQQRAVELTCSSNRPTVQVPRELGINHETLRSWVRQAKADDGERENWTSGERAELVRLRRESAKLRLEREILKKPDHRSSSVTTPDHTPRAYGLT